MQSPICILTIVVAASYSNIACAHPDGAPWGAARPSASENCASCHFDSEVISDSPLLHVEGLPQDPEPGKTYDLRVTLDDARAVVVGFQLIAQAEDDQAGAFVSTVANVESIGAATRSTTPVKNDGTVSWALQWLAPIEPGLPIVFYVAASAANDDGSPLGDRIHFRSYEFLE